MHRVLLVVATLALAGCASAPTPASPTLPAPSTPAAPAPSTPASPTPSPSPPNVVPTPSEPPAGAPGGTNVTNENATNASAGEYVAPVFSGQDAVTQAADPASFANVNPIDYQNPWGSG